ncbi:MAG: DNA polymerase III [Patescibacteria group bacterium]|nr:DNA polymerase III [Patescibacteria group bacterium]
MSNAEISKLLRNVATAYAIKNEKAHRFQIIAYERAADVIEHTTSNLEELIKENRIETLPGIGASIKGHLQELLKTGKVKHFESVLKSIPASVFPLTSIPTFGPKKAFKLAKEFRLKNPKTVVEDVEKLAQKGEIAKLEGFGEKSQSDIIRAISEYKEKKGKTSRMVLPFAFELAEKVVKYLKKSKDIIDAQPLGSLRRMKETVGDVDIAVATNKPESAIKHFLSYPYVERIIEEGDITASILVAGGRQVDLMVQPAESFGSLLQHFTGSKTHNIHLRDYALKNGLSLSEYGIKKKVKVKTVTQKYNREEDFYKAIGMVWIPPELREDTGEIELAIKNKLPKIVELSDIKGDLHIHSSYLIEPSHDLGHDSMEIMLKRARELKYEYFGFSEHNPSISNHNKDDIYTILAKRKEKIEHIKLSNKNIRVINLLEVDILPNGELAIDDKSLSTLDAAIISIHSSFNMNKKDMTKRILKGLSNPKVKIFAHPTGRMLNERPGVNFDFDKIMDFCKKREIALEINAWPNRLDLPDSMVREAVKNGVKMVIDTDSHAVWQMDLMRFGVATARRGWATKNDIINTLPYNKFIEWLKK